MINGKVINNSIDGYERVITLIPKGLSRQLVGHSIQHEEYLEANEKSKIILVGKEYIFNLSIKLVNKYSIHSNTETLEFLQPKPNSPSIAVKGTVVEVVDTDEIKVKIPELGDSVAVEFETDVNVRAGDVIVFTGQLEFELSES